MKIAVEKFMRWFLIWGSMEEIAELIHGKSRETENVEVWLASEIDSNLQYEGLEVDVEIEQV